jgi:hypothetical protein
MKSSVAGFAVKASAMRMTPALADFPVKKLTAWKSALLRPTENMKRRS